MRFVFILKYHSRILFSQTVGDAIADLLAVEAILLLNDMSIVDWDHYYEDAPSCQLKVNVSISHSICYVK